MPVTYTTTHGNAGSSTHWARPGIEPTTSWFLVGFSMTGTPGPFINNSEKHNNLILVQTGFFKIFFCFSCYLNLGGLWCHNQKKVLYKVSMLYIFLLSGRKVFYVLMIKYDLQHEWVSTYRIGQVFHLRLHKPNSYWIHYPRFTLGYGIILFINR